MAQMHSLNILNIVSDQARLQQHMGDAERCKERKISTRKRCIGRGKEVRS